MDTLKQAIVRYADRHADTEGSALTPLPGLRLMCRRRPSGPMPCVYKPLACLILQGAKQFTIGAETQVFSAGQSLVVALDTPLVAQVVQASVEAPYIALAIELDMGLVRDLALELDGVEPASESLSPLFVEDTEAAVLDCALRLMRLLDRPEATSVLYPAISRELHYWLLAGRHGAEIRRLARPDSQAQRIAKAVRILRADYAETVPVERLAIAAGMSVSAFHRRFKAVTSLTPVQFQKQLRLLEARRLMQAEGLSASLAAYGVGYESVSHFSRDYSRMFGVSPRQDLQRPQRRKTPTFALAAATPVVESSSL
ncbi:AraC family transcriptional regulator [Phenylobacterium deserti]|uniref:AraC family transcriptional regulator n=1 Tax=Phenylobacterium deserti TaxID=1914756 RepID=A0A328AB40_9CAUL|nr:AraC family transcriptional regulator [Phenylobacterium deserti]RAK51436.1 AraC family transcriptional regulator [Phenylobacterium deserti]